MPDTPEAAGSAPRTRRTTVRRVVLIAFAAFTAWHIFATFLWIAPPSGLRQIVPGNILHNYMIPMNGQSWSVFAPDPVNGNYRLQVRATVAEGGTTHTTRWVDATAAELSMSHHHLFPPRAAIQSTELASGFKDAYDDLTPDHKKIVALGYFKGDDWDDRLQEKLDSYGSASLVTPYVKAENKVTAYASQVAYAVWGNGVTEVQFVISRQNVIPFAQRHNAGAKPPAPQVAITGWRGPLQQPGQSRDDFGKTFRRALEESGQ